MRKNIITLFIALISVSSLYSQSEIGPALSSQLFSRINYNPAGIGNDGDINIFNMNRMQWAGFDGAPDYTLINIHGYAERIKSGFGGVFSYDKIGIANTSMNAKFAYSYNIDLSASSIISFGASAGVLMKGNDFSSSSGHIYEADANIPETINETNFDSDFGVEFSTPKLLIGASINHLGMMDEATIYSPTQTYYGYVRGTYPINQSIILTPSILYMNSGLTNVVDLNAVAYYEKDYWGGLSFRSGAGYGAGIAVLVGLEWKFLRVGYSYELSPGSTTINSNTHELMLSFKIAK